MKPQTMTVQELMNILNTFDRKAIVGVEGGEWATLTVGKVVKEGPIEYMKGKIIMED